jgi:hypothetical protein
VAFQCVRRLNLGIVRQGDPIDICGDFSLRWHGHSVTARAVCVVSIAVALALSSRPFAHYRESQVTWTTDVEPILKTRCIGCHARNGFGPMSLETYQDARGVAKAIREEVLERRMPPWPAATGFADFSNDRSLTPLEVELLTAWADGNMPLGPPVATADGTHAAAFSRAPDLVVTAPAAQAVTALTARFELATGLAEDRWIAGWEFRPGNRSVIEQAVLRVAPGTLLGEWTPPEGPIVYPSGIAQRLPAGSRLRLELRYRKSATPQTDQSGVALYFGRRPRREIQHRSVPCGTSVIDRDIDALAITPNLPAAGESIEIVARRPDRTVEGLCVVRRYEPGYPITYRFRNNVRLPRGTSLQLRSSSPACAADLDFVAP